MVVIKYKKLHNDAVAPFHKYKTDRGFDLTALTVEREPNRDIYKYGCGLAFEFPEGIDATCCSRSSIYKTGLVLSNGVGIIDNSYRGEVKGVFYHIVKHLEPYKAGERFVQMIINGASPEEVVFEEVTELNDSDRGTGGFGSTGK